MTRHKRTTNHAQVSIDQYQPQLTPTEWAYTAGIIDGEGSISILRVSKRKGLHYILQPVVSVTNTNESLLSWLGMKLDMRVDKRHRPQVIGQNHLKRVPAVCYVITVWGYRVYNLLTSIEPHLIVKKAQAQTVTAFLDSRRERSEALYNPPYIQEELDLWLKVRALNRKESWPYPLEASLTPSSTT